MSPHVQLLKRPLRLSRRQVKRIIRRESQPLHPLAKARQKTKISAKNLPKPIRLGRGDVVRIHLRRVYPDCRGCERSKKTDLEVEQQTATVKLKQ